MAERGRYTVACAYAPWYGSCVGDGERIFIAGIELFKPCPVPNCDKPARQLAEARQVAGEMIDGSTG